MPLSRPEGRPETALVRRVFIGLLVANLMVVAAKFFVGLRAGSLAILGTALDSSVDALNNVLALIVVCLSITCFELVRGAVNELLQGAHPVGVTDSQLAVLVLTLGVNLVIAWYENRRGRELKSELLVADAAHTRTDALITVGVLIGVLFARQGWWWVDPAIAIVVALLIVLVAYRILGRTVPVLVDERALPTGEIRQTAEGVPGVKSAYGIRSRGPSDLRYAEVTIAVDRKADVAAAHAIADQVEERLKNDLQLHEVTVHVEPC